jgi:large subunit ribosomal protein L24
MQDTKRVKNPSKQRKKLFNAPAHIRHKLMSAPLSRELTASRGAKTLPVRKGDTILIKRGDNKGFEGKVSRVDLKAFHIYVEGLTREKVDGTNIFLPIHPSKVEIRNLNLDDKWRKNILERKQAPTKKAEKPIAKPAKKAEKSPAKEEKPVTVTPIEEEAVSLVAEKQAPKITTAEAPAKKTAAKKTTKRAPAAKKTEEEEAPKSRAKPKASEKTDGGQ